MAIFGRNRRYERTCETCGHKWVLTREQARYRVKRPRPNLHGGTALFTITSAVGEAQQLEQEQLRISERYRICPSCGVDDFTQRLLPKGDNAEAAEGPARP